MPTARQQCAATVVNGIMYVAAGYPGPTSIGRLVELYSVATDTWATGLHVCTGTGLTPFHMCTRTGLTAAADPSPLPAPVALAMPVPLCAKVPCARRAQCGSAVAGYSLPTNRENAAVVAAGTRVYSLGSYIGSPSPTAFEMYLIPGWLTVNQMPTCASPPPTSA